MCSVKKVFLEVLQNTCARVPFCQRTRLWHRSFPVNFAKFLRIPFFIEYLWWLFLYFHVAMQPNNSLQLHILLIYSFEKFSKNLYQNLKLIFLFSTLFVHFKISYRQSFITVLRISFFIIYQLLYIATFFILSSSFRRKKFSMHNKLNDMQAFPGQIQSVLCTCSEGKLSWIHFHLASNKAHL